MAVQLKKEEIVTVNQVLSLEEKITDDEKRPLGLACHQVVEEFEWDMEDEGHLFLMQLLKNIKNALGVRASKKKDLPKKKASKKKNASKKKAAAGGTEGDAETTSGGTNGDQDPETNEETTTSPPEEAGASTEEPSSSEGAGGDDLVEKEEPGADIHDPFAVPPGSQAG